MMKKYAFILWAALTMTGVFTACTNNESPMAEQTEAKTVTIRATIDGAIGSRVALTDNAENRLVKVDWKQDDAFKINVNGKDYTFTYSESAGEFTYSGTDFPETFTSAGTVTATYPATVPTAYANQSGTLEGAGSLLAMTATLDVTAGQSTENLTLNFKHNNSIVKLTLKNDDFKGKHVTPVTLRSGNTSVATATGTFTGDADDGSIVAYFTVTPRAMTAVSIRAVCEYKNYTAALTDNTLEAGKLYNVEKTMEKVITLMGTKTAEQAVKGDYAMADGSFISKDATLTDEQKANVRGIVFWTANQPTTATTTPAKLTDDKIMNADFPNCTHGLIVSLKNVSTGISWQSTDTDIASWQKSDAFNPENKSDYKSIASSSVKTDLINFILGYQNTKILKAYNASLASGSPNTVLPVSLLANFETDNPAPANTTGWFIPSEKELTLLCGKDVDNVGSNNSGDTNTKAAMNTILSSFGTNYADIFDISSYYSSSENSAGYVFNVNFSNGEVRISSKVRSAASTRAVCAF